MDYVQALSGMLERMGIKIREVDRGQQCSGSTAGRDGLFECEISGKYIATTCLVKRRRPIRENSPPDHFASSTTIYQYM
jgi:hypothetical protein